MSESVQHQEDVTIRQLQVSQVKVLGANRLFDLGRRNWNKREYFALIKIGKEEKKTNTFTSKSPVFSKTLIFTNINHDTDFEIVLHAKRQWHKDEEVGRISVSLKSILECSSAVDGSCTLTRDLISCPGAQLEFLVKTIAPRSLASETTDAVAEASLAIDHLSPPSAIQTMVRAKEVGGELLEGADIVEEALSPIVKKTDFSAFIKNVEVFVGIVDTIAEVHPYAKMAWLLVKGVYTIVQDQIHRDDKVKDLFLQMASLYEIVEDLRRQLEDGGIESSTELLSCISKQTVDCCYFIRDYSSPEFIKRMAKSTFATVNKRILEYTDAFKSLKDEFYGNLHVETRVIVSLVLKGVERLETTVDLNDMSYSPSSLGPSKRCLFGTREEPLERMTTWANSDSQDHPSILVLTGPAGTGKSALAHTMAHQFRELERLGSSFGFDRNESTRSIKLLFPTIARDLADLNDDIRNALWAAVGKSKEIRMTQDLSLQFENLIAKPLKSIVLSGPVLVVIDALDECGDAGTREQLLSILKTCADNFPPNLRLLITTRPEDDILTHFQDAPHILIWRMDDISPSINTAEDIRVYIHHHLISSRKPKLEGIDDECCRRLVAMSQGLFQWASVACSQIIGTGKPGLTARERYELLVEGISGPRVDQERLLDKLYLDVLRQMFTDESTGELELARFRSVLVAALASFEPMTLESLNNLRKASNIAGEPYFDAQVVLQYLGSLLSGVTASESHIPIRPLHTSFRDFLTTKQRSLEFSVDVAELQAHERLCLASLRIMKRDLAFNICKLESLYVMNEDILDLPKRIENRIPSHLSYSCRFWARHLDVALPNGMALEISHQIRELLEPFINEKLLFWLEVLSVLGGVALALSAFAIVARVLKSSQTPNNSLLGCVTDIQRFLTNFASVIIISAPHIYISAVPFSPQRSWISKQYLPRLPRTLRVLNSPEDWPVARDVMQHSDHICGFAISVDGARIAGACGWSGVFIWDIRTGLLDSGLLNCGGFALRVAFSADGARVAYALKKGTIIGVWDVESGRNWTIAESIFGPDSDDEVVCLTFSPDGRKLIAGSWHGTVGVWDTSSGDASGAILYQSIMKCSFDCVSFLSHGGALACGYKEKTIEVCKWDATTLQLTEQPLHIEAESSVSAVGVSFDGRHVAAGLENDTICLWGLPEGTPIGTSVSVSSRTEWRVWWIAFTQDGSHFASAGRRGAVDVWKITPTGPILEVSLQGHTSWVGGLAYSPDGRHLFFCSDDRTIRKWDAHSTNTPDPIIPQSASSIVGVHISHDETRIASVSEDGTVRLWNGASGTAIGSPSRLPTRELDEGIYHSAMSRDGTRIMAVSRGMVRLSDFKGCKQTERRIELDTYKDSTGVFSADGSRIYITSRNRIYTIDVDTMEETPDLSTWKAFPVLWFYGPPVISPDGAQLAVLSVDMDETVRLRILDSQTVEEVSLPMLLRGSILYCWCISPDFHYVANIGLSHEPDIQVMCIEGGILQKDLSLAFDHRGWCCLVFLSYTTGTHLASAHGSGIVIWDLVSCKPIIGPLRHSNSEADVKSMACLQDGKRLVAGYEDGKVLVWDISVFGDSHSGHPVIPIVLSSEAAHALPHPKDILSPKVAAFEAYGKRNPINTVEMTGDGWIVGPNLRRLLWVPPELRARIWPKMMKWDLTGGEERIQLDLSQFARGPRWADCYCECTVDSDVP